MKTFTIITLFPEFFSSPLASGLLGKAVSAGLFDVRVVDLREYSHDRFKRCDDYPYGGGSGMVMLAEPLFRSLDDAVDEKTTVICTTPAGEPFTQDMVKELAAEDDICVICGHYEGIDQRVIDKYVDREISIGDYVLSGGEYAAIVMLDAIARYVPGFMSNADSLSEESFEGDLLEYPQYTRPALYDGMAVPDVLLSGHHEKVAEWRLAERIEKTKRVRPDLYKKYCVKDDRGDKQ